MIQLKYITENEFQYLVDWNNEKDEEYLFQWAGPQIYKYPITTEQIKMRTQAENVQIFVILSNGKAVGSIELVKLNQSLANVGRFIIREDEKSKGIGTFALKKIAEMAFTEMNLSKLILGVFCYNVSAIRCYEKCGFLVKEYRKSENANMGAYTMELVSNAFSK